MLLYQIANALKSGRAEQRKLAELIIQLQLKRLHVPLPPGDLTAGDASMILDRVLAQKKTG